MTRKILILLGHPRSQSLCGALAEAFGEGAGASGAQLRTITLSDIAFDAAASPDTAVPPLEPGLQHLQESIRWADHLALVYPNWWGGAPGLFKTALERALVPGFAFKYHTKGGGWDRHLMGRSAEMIVTMDTPPWIYRLLFRAAGDHIMARRTLDFCGIKPIRITHFGPVRSSNQTRRASWLAKVRLLGAKASR